jgi:MFS family permease
VERGFESVKGRDAIRRDRSTWVAWALLALGCLGNAAAIALSVAEGSLLGEHPGEALLWIGFTAFLVVGCLILARRPGNVIGWIFTAIGLLTMAAALAENYAQYAYAHPGSLPGPLVAAWVLNFIWGPLVVLVLVFPLLLFPTGRSLSPRWRPVTWLAIGLTVALTVLGMLRPSLFVSDEQTIANPIGVAGVDLETAPLSTILTGLALCLLAAAVVSLIVRFRRSRGVERQQLKWFTYAGALVLLIPLIGFVVPSLANAAFVLVGALPIAVGIAILRHRLYDIDRLINRTLVYGLLTAILGALYAGVVLVLGQLFGGVGGDPPSWAVAGATLAVAALFQPARRRIQVTVDQRFNRRKYDAARTVEVFSVRLRDEVDLDTLSAELLTVVDQTMQPTQASLWLRPPIEQARQTGG